MADVVKLARPEFILARVEGGGWKPEILQVPVLGTRQPVLVAFEDYFVGQDFVNDHAPISEVEGVLIDEEQWRGVCRTAAEVGIVLVLIYLQRSSDEKWLYRGEGVLAHANQ